MHCSYTRLFVKQVSQLKDKLLLAALKASISEVQEVTSLANLPKVKKLSGSKDCYRLRLQAYRSCRAAAGAEGHGHRYSNAIHSFYPNSPLLGLQHPTMLMLLTGCVGGILGGLGASSAQQLRTTVVAAHRHSRKYTSRPEQVV